ncbi:MAG: putative sulfate exporter family transporter [Alistipes indistinctus]
MLFGEILEAGFFGILQGIVVVFSVWYFTFWLARKMKVDEEMGVMLSSAVSICGVSAAIATCGAIKGDSKKLSFVVSIVLIVAIPMMYLMPYLAKLMGLSQEVAGAWLGGTIGLRPEPWLRPASFWVKRQKLTASLSSRRRMSCWAWLRLLFRSIGRCGALRIQN